MKKAIRFFIFLLACHLRFADASPTSDDYLQCHKKASLILLECLKENPNDRDACWSTVRGAHEACYAEVAKSYRPDRERVEAQRKAMEMKRQ